MSAVSLDNGNDQVSFCHTHINTWSNQWCYGTVIHSEKCALRRFRYSVNVVECNDGKEESQLDATITVYW